MRIIFLDKKEKCKEYEHQTQRWIDALVSALVSETKKTNISEFSACVYCCNNLEVLLCLYFIFFKIPLVGNEVNPKL